VLFIVLPVFFYRQAYVARPSKKDRTCQLCLGNLVLAIALPIGVLGVLFNVNKMIYGEAEAAEIETVSD